MEIPEIIIIALIIILWLLSIKKFIKQFERIRTTHYREIPYSYYSKKINDNKITIVKRETDSIIHIAPQKISRSRSLPSNQFQNKSISEKNFDINNKNTNNSPSTTHIQNSSNQIYNSFNLKRKSISNNELCKQSSISSPFKSLILNKKNADSLSPIIFEFDASPKKIVQSKDSNLHENPTRFLFSPNKNLINPLLIPPIVRRSLLDLHRKSAEHLNYTTQKAMYKNAIFFKTNENEFVESPV